LVKELSSDEGITKTHQIVGTPNYMAPEQAAGRKDVDWRVDVYALGVILFELLTDRVPFQGSVLEILAQIEKNEPPLPSRLNKRVPRDLETICLKCLRKEREKRYESAKALADDLQRFLDFERISARREQWSEWLARVCRRNPYAARFAGLAAALAVVALVLGGIWFAKYRHQQFVERVPQDLFAMEKEDLRTRGEILEKKSQHLDADSKDAKERFLATYVQVLNACNDYMRGNEKRAEQELSKAIAKLDSNEAQRNEFRYWIRLVRFGAYTSRATLYEASAHRKLPVNTTRSKANMPKVEIVVAGTKEFAKAFLDFDKAIKYRDSSKADFELEGPLPKKCFDLALDAKGTVLALTRFYLVKGLLERNHIKEALEVAELLDPCPSLLAGEPHYDLACVYGRAYAKWPQRDRLAEKALGHLRKAQKLGFGKDETQTKMGTIKKPFTKWIQQDSDLASIRKHPKFLSLIEELQREKSGGKK
jgi:hypothetical protein